MIWRQKTLRSLTCEKKFERYVTRLLSGERDLDLYTPALWCVPEPHFWVETRLKPVGLQNFHSAGGTLKILAPKSECDQQAIHTRPDAFRYEPALPEPIPHSQSARRPPQGAVFRLAIVVPTRVGRCLAHGLLLPSCALFAATWYMSAMCLV